MNYYICRNELYHHGIKGQKWGIRRFQNSDGTLTAEGKERYGEAKHIGQVRKVSKELLKEHMYDYMDKNPYATKKEMKAEEKEIKSQLKDMELRAIADNKKLRTSSPSTAIALATIPVSMLAYGGAQMLAEDDNIPAAAASAAAGLVSDGVFFYNLAKISLEQDKISRARAKYGKKYVMKFVEEDE